MLSGVSRTVTTFGVAVALCASPALAAALLSPTTALLASGASQTPVQTLSPIVALSIYGSQTSVVALCSANLAGAVGANSADVAQSPASGAPPASGEAAIAEAPKAGCVLPVIDSPPVATVGDAPPPGFVPFALGPLLAGLAAIGGGAAAIAAQGSGNNANPPVSVN